jgi:hypothetical protein
MTHDFIISTENVNEYGYRILTSGIDYKQYMRNPIVLFMHEREYNKTEKQKGSAVIGRCIKIYKDGTDLKATIEFDTDDEFAKSIEGKVSRGFIRMASIYAEPKESSSEPELILPGQMYETITKCKLVEISIVDIGGNDDALKLSKGNKQMLTKLSLNTKNRNMSKLGMIALALGIVADSNEDAVLNKVTELKLASDKAHQELTAIKLELSNIKTAEATTLVDKAIVLGLLPESLKDTQIKAFNSDFEAQKVILSKLISDKEAEKGLDADQSKIKEVILSGKSSKPSGNDTKETFDYLQKFDSIKLAKIRKDTPEVYEKLAQDYANGVRHKE